MSSSGSIRYPDFANVLLVTLIALPFATDLAMLGGGYRGVLKPAPFMLANYVVQPTVRLIIMGLLFALGFRLWAVVVATCASYILSWAVLALVARRDLAVSGTSHRLDWADIRSVFLYAPSLAASLIFVVWIRSANSLFLGYFGSAKDVGQYAAILMIAQLIGLIGEALGQTLGPRVALCYRNNDLAAMERLLAENVRRITLVSAPIFAAILFWGDRIDLVLGPTFEVDASVVALVASRIFLQTIFGCSGFALSMTGWHVREAILLGFDFCSFGDCLLGAGPALWTTRCRAGKLRDTIHDKLGPPCRRTAHVSHSDYRNARRGYDRVGSHNSRRGVALIETD